MLSFLFCFWGVNYTYITKSSNNYKNVNKKDKIFIYYIIIYIYEVILFVHVLFKIIKRKEDGEIIYECDIINKERGECKYIYACCIL